MYASSLQFIKNEWGKRKPTNVLVYLYMQKKKVGKKNYTESVCPSWLVDKPGSKCPVLNNLQIWSMQTMLSRFSDQKRKYFKWNTQRTEIQICSNNPWWMRFNSTSKLFSFFYPEIHIIILFEGNLHCCCKVDSVPYVKVFAVRKKYIN